MFCCNIDIVATHFFYGQTNKSKIHKFYSSFIEKITFIPENVPKIYNPESMLKMVDDNDDNQAPYGHEIESNRSIRTFFFGGGIK